MNHTIRRNRITVTRSDLLAAGFTTAEVDALEALRPICPYIEFFDSRRELEHLQFMKWMINREPVAAS